MFKKIILSCLLLVIIMPTKAQTNDDAQWDAYKNIIPSHESITLSQEKGRSDTRGSYRYSYSLTIRNNYTVSFRASGYENGDIYENDYPAYDYNAKGSASANGILKWDTEGRKMIVSISGEASGSCRYRDTRKDIRVTDYSDRNTIEKTFTIKYNAETKVFYVENEVKYEIKTGYTTLKSSIDRNAVCTYGNKKNSTSTLDQFGEWQWTKDRSDIYLKSSTSDSKLHIVRPQKKVSEEWEKAYSDYTKKKESYLNKIKELENTNRVYQDSIFKHQSSLNTSTPTLIAYPKQTVDTLKSTDTLQTRQNPQLQHQLMQVESPNKYSKMQKQIDIMNDSIEKNKTKIGKIRQMLLNDSIIMASMQKYDIHAEKLHLFLKLSRQAKGIKPQTTEDGVAIDVLELSFDGESPNAFLFENRGAGLYRFVTYNRFLNEMNYEASSIIEQIARKQTINVDYRLSNGEKKTEMFMLEGLETIMEYIK